MDTHLHGNLTASDSTPLFVARALSAAQGAIWLVLLIHGGVGLLFGPMAWLSMLIGGRVPAIAAGLLLTPVAWLIGSWAPILSDEPQPRDWLIVGTLVFPALLAAMFFLRRASISMARRVRSRVKATQEAESAAARERRT